MFTVSVVFLVIMTVLLSYYPIFTIFEKQIWFLLLEKFTITKNCSLAPERPVDTRWRHKKRNLNNLEVDVEQHDSSNDRYQKSFIVWSSVVCLGIYTRDFQVHANKKTYKHLILNDSIVSKRLTLYIQKIQKFLKILKF